MQRTIFNTPVVNTVLKAFSATFLRLSGWRVEGHLPNAVSALALTASAP
jgi:hypothetical protein